MGNSLRPLSREPFFNERVINISKLPELSSSPFSGTFFQSATNTVLNLTVHGLRPLSREPFFNGDTKMEQMKTVKRLRPLSREPFFNINSFMGNVERSIGLRPLSREPFFNFSAREHFPQFDCLRPLSREPFFNFFKAEIGVVVDSSLRPLSREPFFNRRNANGDGQSYTWSSSPFSGTFFQFSRLNRWKNSQCIEGLRPLSREPFFNYNDRHALRKREHGGLRPLSREPFFNSVPAKPQPVCSRKRIRGGDGGIASSGTLLRR